MSIVSRTFDQLVDFTRTSAATYVNSSGMITTTPASTNMLLYTQDFDAGTWAKSSTTVSANTITAPDDTPTGDTITASGANGTVVQSYTASAVPYTFSVWLRRLTGAGNIQITVDAVTYVTVAVTTSWTRFETTLTPSAGTRSAGIRIVTSGDAVYAFGAQLQTGSSATTYVRNYGGLYPARYNFDPVTLLPRGMLVESQRTNLAIYSNDFTNAAWVKTDITAAMTATGPDGAANSASTITASNANGTALQTITSASAARATSCYVKRRTGTGVIEMTQDNGGTWTAVTATSSWTRVTIPSATVTNPVVGFRIATNGDAIDVYGFQCESGAFPTSVIPTVASQVTRTVDLPLVQSPNFAPWYNQTEGTFVIEFTPDTAVTSNTIRLMTVSQAAAAARVIDIYTGTTTWQSYNGTTNVVGPTASATSTTQKLATSYRSGDWAICLNGGTVGTATSATVNSPTLMTIGYFSSGNSQQLNGHIRSLTYYPAKLANERLQALTT